MPRDVPGQADWLAPSTPAPQPRKKSKEQLVRDIQLEHELQIACADLFEQILLPDVTWTGIDSAFSINKTIGRNGRPIGWGELAKRKARGIKAGVPDIALWHLGRAFAIELKVGDNELTDKQEDFLRRMIRSGVEVAVCWSLDQVLGRLRLWGLCRNARVMA